MFNRRIFDRKFSAKTINKIGTAFERSKSILRGIERHPQTKTTKIYNIILSTCTNAVCFGCSNRARYNPINTITLLITQFFWSSKCAVSLTFFRFGFFFRLIFPWIDLPVYNTKKNCSKLSDGFF